MWGTKADAHVNKGGTPYDIATGEGHHNGQPVDVVHQHAPREAKYVLLGEGSRIDLHPWAAELLPEAKVVFLVMEGTPKTDAVLSAGGVAFGIPSVTCWDPQELETFATDNLRGKTVLVVPDADWATNPQVERQALKVRTLLRRLGIDADVCAPPHDADDYHKGIDDYLGAGYALGDLEVSGREPQYGRIREAVADVPYRRRKYVARAVEDLSLYADGDGKVSFTFAGLKNLLGIPRSDRAVSMLEALEATHTFTVEKGSLEPVKRSVFYGKYEETVFTKPQPTIAMSEQFRAWRKRAKLSMMDYHQGAAIDVIRDELDELKGRLGDLEQRAT